MLAYICDALLCCSMLRRNALRCQPTQWQCKNLPALGPNCPWIATFLCPIFPDSSGDPDARISPNEQATHSIALGAVALLAKSSDTSSTAKQASPTMKATPTAQAPVTSSAVMCAACDRPPSEGVPLLRCGRCQAAWYCCKGCQKGDWTRHKGRCHK